MYNTLDGVQLCIRMKEIKFQKQFLRQVSSVVKTCIGEDLFSFLRPVNYAGDSNWCKAVLELFSCCFKFDKLAG